LAFSEVLAGNKLGGKMVEVYNVASSAHTWASMLATVMMMYWSSSTAKIRCVTSYFCRYAGVAAARAP